MNAARRAVLATVFGALMAAVLPAMASEDPIPGVDVVVEKVPPGHAFAAQTDRNGYLAFKSLSAGNYFITDRHGNKAAVKHPGGPAKWRLVGTAKGDKPVWTLVDQSKPL